MTAPWAERTVSRTKHGPGVAATVSTAPTLPKAAAGRVSTTTVPGSTPW